MPRARAEISPPELDELCRAKISELVQPYLSFEVDEALQRARYERIAGEAAKTYRNGFDDPRTNTTGAAGIRIGSAREMCKNGFLRLT